VSDSLIVVIPHRLGKEEAIRRLRGGLSHPALNSAAIVVAEEKWAGDRLNFKIHGRCDRAVINVIPTAKLGLVAKKGV
jgi:hypothetical protein